MNLATFNLPLADATTQSVETSTSTSTAAPGGVPASRPATPRPFWANEWTILIPLMILMFVFMSRSKSKQQKQEQELLNSLKKGARIQTIGGIIGTVVEVRDDEVVVKVDETSNTKMTFVRKAIFRVREEEKK